MRIALTTAWLYGVFLVLAAAMLVMTIPCLLLGRLRRRPDTETAREIIWRFGRACIKAAGLAVPVEISRPGAIKNIGPAIVAVNHQSALDIFLLAAQDAKNVCFLSRGWPFRKLFFFRPLMRLAGYIETESSPAGAVLDQCRRELEAGACIAGFPEGTRAPDGVLGRFHSGIFKLAVDTGFRIVPMVIHDSHKIFPKGAWIFRPGKIHIEVLPPVDPAVFQGEAIPHGALRRHVRSLFADRLRAGYESAV